MGREREGEKASSRGLVLQSEADLTPAANCERDSLPLSSTSHDCSSSPRSNWG